MTRSTIRTMLAGMLVLAAAQAATADGMIVPVHPEVRVSGHWAVSYHHVNVRVRDQVASVSIDQEFVNTGKGMIEVEYFFPVPPDAAIDSMTMIVNGKEFAARLLEADEARKIYEDIVRRKKDPALLEYAGFGLYRTRAFPLEPGKPAKVVVTYKNICRRDRDLVEVWYPLNTEKFSAKPIRSVRVRADIKADADILSVYSPSHDLDVDRKAPDHVIATYEESDVLPVTDFQVFYKATVKDVGATLLTTQGEDDEDGYFMLLVSPNPRIAREKVAPKDVIIAFDHSGSMSGEKITQAREALGFVLRNLNRRDRFNVVAYNDAVETFFERGLVPADREHVDEALEMLDRVDATGGTNVHQALTRAMEIATGGEDRKAAAYVLFLTDGKPTVGVTDESAILRAASKANAADARLFAFGVGYDVNVRLLDRLAQDNSGRSDYVKPEEPVEGKITSLYNKIKNPVMTGLELTVEDVHLHDVYPRNLTDLFDGDQIVAVGRFDSRDVRKTLRRGRTQIVISGIYQGRERAFEYPVKIPAGAHGKAYDFVEKLWAVRRVGYLLDEIQLHGESEEVIDELVRLSKKYGIMTPYTSFLADESTPLARRDRGEVMEKAGRFVSEHLAGEGNVSGRRGQTAAMNRQILREAKSAPTPARPSGAPEDSVQMLGYAGGADYEADRKSTVGGVRQVGNAAIYQRGKIWIAANAADLDPEEDAEEIETIDRFSEKYFELVRANTTRENQILATQQANEELIVRLRGQVYRIR